MSISAADPLTIDPTIAKEVIGNKHSAEAIEVRREQVLSLSVQGVKSKEIAEILGVSSRTIEEDLKALRKIMQGRIKEHDVAGEIGKSVAILEGIRDLAMREYVSAKGKMTKATLLSTAMRAEVSKAKLLVGTGIWPSPTHKISTTLDIDGQVTLKEAPYGREDVKKVLESPESRRRVLSVLEKVVSRFGGVLPDLDSLKGLPVKEAQETIDAHCVTHTE